MYSSNFTAVATHTHLLPLDKAMLLAACTPVFFWRTCSKYAFRAWKLCTYFLL